MKMFSESKKQKLEGLMENLKLSLVVILIGLASSACQNSSDSKKNDDEQRRIVEVQRNMDSDQLAEAGEQLVMPHTFMLAQKAFDMALEKNPNNEKALLYTALLKPFMKTRGLAARIRPYVQRYGDTTEYENGIKKSPNSALKKFLLDDSGLMPISKDSDVLDFLADQTDAYEKLRKHLIAHQDTEIVFSLNLLSAGLFTNQAKDSCIVTDNPQGGFKVDCDLSEAAQVKMNRADMVVLRQMVGGYVFLLSMYTSYSLDGLEDALNSQKNNNLHGEALANYFERRMPNAGKLRADNKIVEWKNFGADFLASMRWAQQYQGQLCPKGQSVANQRKGYIFNQGLCIDNNDETNRGLALLERVLAGAVEMSNSEYITAEMNNARATIDYFAWSRNPVKDLRQLLPASYNKCGEAASLRDKTFGGIYPKGDAELFMIGKCN